MNNIKIVSYPRTGANFLAKCIKEQTNLDIPVTHFLEDAKYIINIVRRPEDSIASLVTMGIEANKYDIKKKYQYTNAPKSSIDQEIYHLINYYNIMYDFLIKHNAIFIKYEDFNNINLLMLKLYQKLDINFSSIKEINSVDIMSKLNLGSEYLLTSKESHKYTEVLDIMSGHDFDSCNTRYYSILNKCIDLV